MRLRSNEHECPDRLAHTYRGRLLHAARRSSVRRRGWASAWCAWTGGFRRRLPAPLLVQATAPVRLPTRAITRAGGASRGSAGAGSVLRGATARKPSSAHTKSATPADRAPTGLRVRLLTLLVPRHAVPVRRKRSVRLRSSAMSTLACVPDRRAPVMATVEGAATASAGLVTPRLATARVALSWGGRSPAAREKSSWRRCSAVSQDWGARSNEATWARRAGGAERSMCEE